MHYISTRGQAPPLGFADTVLTGLASDGGLFLPQSLPDMSAQLADWRGLPFAELFTRVVAPYIGDAVSEADLADLAERSFGVFDHPQVTPVVPVGPIWVCELFHGPTLAFKDVALQFLGNLFEHFLERRGTRMTVVGATSGDTGSAAIHALKGRRGVEVFILFPHGRVSPMQELQMTSVAEANIHCIAVDGSFDDAQALVKAMFNDRAFNEAHALGAINSINWARVMAQISYYFYAYFRAAEQSKADASSGGTTPSARPFAFGDAVRFAVPTGNFGDIYAGCLARRMGLPIERLILATNRNAILDDLVRNGRYLRGEVHQTLSPSMDIQVASNFERYLSDLVGGDAGKVRTLLDSLAREGGFELARGDRAQMQREFSSLAVNDEQTLDTIRRVHAEHGYLLDPHSATGYRAALEHGAMETPTITMATAHPAKFGDAIRQAIGGDPPLPPALAELRGKPTRVERLPATLGDVQSYIRATLAD